MMLVIAYDVDTTSSAGSQRLRKVARLCERHGIRVQNSVFEVLLDPAQLVALKAGLEKIICKETDSIRIYRLGNSYLSLIHISEPTRQAEISYAVFCLKKKKKK